MVKQHKQTVDCCLKISVNGTMPRDARFLQPNYLRQSFTASALGWFWRGWCTVFALICTIRVWWLICFIHLGACRCKMVCEEVDIISKTDKQTKQRKQTNKQTKETTKKQTRLSNNKQTNKQTNRDIRTHQKHKLQQKGNSHKLPQISNSESSDNSNNSSDRNSSNQTNKKQKQEQQGTITITMTKTRTSNINNCNNNNGTTRTPTITMNKNNLQLISNKRWTDNNATTRNTT